MAALFVRAEHWQLPRTEKIGRIDGGVATFEVHTGLGVKADWLVITMNVHEIYFKRRTLHRLGDWVNKAFLCVDTFNHHVECGGE